MPKPIAATVPLREIAGHLTLSRDAMAWYVLPPVPWAWRDDSTRATWIYQSGLAIAALAGRRLHLRVTHLRVPAAALARKYHQQTMALGLTPPDAKAWDRELVEAQQRLRRNQTTTKVVMLGVHVADFSVLDRIESALRRGRHSERALSGLRNDVRRIDQIMRMPGLDGRPASGGEMEWFAHRSVGLHLPEPYSLRDYGGVIDPDDSSAWTDGVDLIPGRETTKVVGTRVRNRDGSHAYVAILSVGRMEPLTIPGQHEPWLSALDRLGFPVEISAHLNVISGPDAARQISRKLDLVRDQLAQYDEHRLDAPPQLEIVGGLARQVRHQMLEGDALSATRIDGVYRLAVAGRSEDECLDRVRALTQLYAGMRVNIEHPRAQAEMLREFIPGSTRVTNAHRRRMPVLTHAAAVPGIETRVGDRTGMLLGHTAGTTRVAVHLDVHTGIVQREVSGLMPLIGGLGSGKSVITGMFAVHNARRGVATTVCDPSGPLAALCSIVPGAVHVDLLGGGLAGVLSPWAVVATPRRDSYPHEEDWREAVAEATRERKSLATDALIGMLPPALAEDARTLLVIPKAVGLVGGQPGASLYDVVDRLRDSDVEPTWGKVLADQFAELADYPRARLFFPAGDGDAIAATSASLLVITMAGLVTPPQGSRRAEWTVEERMSLLLLQLGVHLASSRVYRLARETPKFLGLDEFHAITATASGLTLARRLARDSRKWRTHVLAASQDAADILGTDIANQIGAALVGQTEDQAAQQQALRLLRVPTGVGYESALATLAPRTATGQPPYRDFVLRDFVGLVDRVRVEPSEELLAVLDPNRNSGPRALGAREEVYAR
jgi:hypothetical protein